MRVMIFAKSQPGAENPPNPAPEAMQAFWKFNEELVAAGILLAGDRLHPSPESARVHFEGTSRTVTDGPFTEAKNLSRASGSGRSGRWTKPCNGSSGHPTTVGSCLLYTSPSPRDRQKSRMPSSA